MALASTDLRRFARILLAVSSLALARGALADTLALSGQPGTSVPTGKYYSFVPTLNHSGTGTVKFYVNNLPSWAWFDISTGQLAGTAPASTGTYSNIVIYVTAGTARATLPAFSIVVTAPYVAPTISGTPVMSTFVGTAYSFKPTVTNPSGRTLTFSIQNKPSWASFNTSTGLLCGTPTAAGQFASVTIGVSDGKSTASLRPFTLTVSPVVTGSATLSWTVPTENVDGTPLTDLAGFRVVYGTSPTALNQTLELPNPAMTSASVEELTSGTYYFAVKAYNSSNVESDVSPVLWKTIM